MRRAIPRKEASRMRDPSVHREKITRKCAECERKRATAHGACTAGGGQPLMGA